MSNMPEKTYSEFLDRIRSAVEKRVKKEFWYPWAREKDEGSIEVRFTPIWDEAEKWVQEFFGDNQQCIYVHTSPILGKGTKRDYQKITSSSEKIEIISGRADASSTWSRFIVIVTFEKSEDFAKQIVKAVIDEIKGFFGKEGYDFRILAG